MQERAHLNFKMRCKWHIFLKSALPLSITVSNIKHELTTVLLLSQMEMVLKTVEKNVC